MILYQLQCELDHQFEAWFKDSQAFDKQAKRNLLSCPSCGSEKISKALMAPRIGKSVSTRPVPSSKNTTSTLDIKTTQEATELKKKLQELQKHITEKCRNISNGHKTKLQDIN